MSPEEFGLKFEYQNVSGLSADPLPTSRREWASIDGKNRFCRTLKKTNKLFQFKYKYQSAFIELKLLHS